MGLEVRLVPISASQIQAFESLERALSGLAADFWRDYGAGSDTRIAGGLYRLSSALEMVIEEWRDGSEDVAAVEERRRALEQIARSGLTGSAAREVAVRALTAETESRREPQRG